ncbi:MAG: hypothetical protein ACT4OS_12160 [Acidimicrobiales bacterium]
MVAAVAEHLVRSRWGAPLTRVRVDLHGVSVFGSGGERALLRWEWITTIEADPSGVVVGSEATNLTLPPGSFNLPGPELAERLGRARSIVDRPEVIGTLVEAAGR